jgi:AraC family L-rhamnose operon regulatory protein RhaS
MPTSPTPIYRGQKSRFEVDSCVPQSAAVRGGKIKMHALTKGHYPGVLVRSGQLPSITSVGFWNGTGPQDWGLEAHRNEGVEICFLETGAMAFSVETNNFKLRSGQFTITRPWQLHKLGAPNIGPGKLHWLILDVGVRRPNQEWRWPRWLTLTDADRDELTRKLRHNENAVWNSSPEISAAFRGLSDCVMKWKEPLVESRMFTLLNQLLLGILTALTVQQTYQNPDLTSSRRTVELFLHDLASNAASSSQPWTLQKMASHCGMGITAFSKYCRELVNNGPVEYLNQCRLACAARQLREDPDRSVTEIALLNGFNSGQYFATCFRRRFHQTPRAYRARSNAINLLSMKIGG